MSLGELIRTRRRAKRLSQRDLAQLVGISHTTVAHYEKDLIAPSIPVRARLAEVLSINPADILPEMEKVALQAVTVTDPVTLRLIRAFGRLNPSARIAVLMAVLAILEGQDSQSDTPPPDG